MTCEHDWETVEEKTIPVASVKEDWWSRTVVYETRILQQCKKCMLMNVQSF